MEPVRGTSVDLRDRADRDLVAAIARRDEDALRELYRRYGGLCFGLARRVASDQTLAEDVVQEVFTTVWQRAEDFVEERGSVRAWLLTQAHHRAVDVVRRETSSRRRNVALTLPDPEREERAPDAVVEEEWIALRRAQVREAITGLSVEQREVLELAYFGGLTQREIADRIDIPLGTVKSRTITALRVLRGRLGAEPGEEER